MAFIVSDEAVVTVLLCMCILLIFVYACLHLAIANTVAAISSSFLPETNGRELATLSPISANKEEKNFT